MWPKGRQLERFKTLLNPILENRGRALSILDFGCGLGDMYYFIENKMNRKFNYLGVDINPDFINDCRSRNINAELINGHQDIIDSYDVIVCSGVFNIKYFDSNQKNQLFVQSVLDHLIGKTNYYFASDFMRTQVDFTQEGAWHQDLNALVNFVTKHTRRILIDMTELDYEYTLKAWK